MIFAPFLVALFASVASAKPFLPPLPTSAGPIKSLGISTDTTLKLRGGSLGSTSISKDDVSMFAILALNVRGTLLASDAGKFVQPMGVTIKPGSLAAWCGEHLGWATIGLAKAAFISRVTNLTPLKSCALGGIPCLFFNIKSTYSGTLEALGFHKMFGPAMIAWLLGVMYATFKGGIDEDIVKAIIVVPLALVGAAGVVAPETSIKMLGPSFSTDADEHMWKSLAGMFGMFSAFTYTMLYQDGSATESMASAFLVWLINSLDIRFLRTDSWKKMGASKNTADLYLVFVAAITGLLFADEGNVTPA